MPKEYFFLYLIYGFAFINMGIFSIKEKDIELVNIPLVKHLKYLGYFGLIHGISEWVTMVTVVDLYPDSYTYLFILKQFLKAISFSFLMFFGISLLPLRNKKIALKLPIVLFFTWLVGFIVLLLNYGLDYHILNPKYNTVIVRYLMAFSGCIISAMAIYLNAKLIEKRQSNSMAKRYKALACIFLIYGFLDGLLVRQMDFFPANIINNSLFLEYFKLPTQILKACVGLAINFLLIKVIDTFGWERREKLNRLQNHRIASEERRKLGLEIHDSIIQGLYAAGLKVEYLMQNKAEGKIENILKEIKIDLNNTIEKTREFLTSTTLDLIELEDLNDNLEQLVKKFNDNGSIKINLKCERCSLSLGNISPEKSTQIYYIIQEAISNIIKHSKATCADVILESRPDFLYIKVIDDGIGICIENINPQRQFGISSMRERTERVGGLFNIEKIKKGTRVELTIPWEESKNE